MYPTWAQMVPRFLPSYLRCQDLGKHFFFSPSRNLQCSLQQSLTNKMEGLGALSYVPAFRVWLCCIFLSAKFRTQGIGLPQKGLVRIQ